MQLKRYRDIEWADLPKIESPLFASSHVERAITDGRFGPRISGVDDFLREGALGINRSRGGDRHALKRLLKRIERAEVFLLHGSNSDPFGPIVSWQADNDNKEKGRWVVHSSWTSLQRSKVQWLIDHALPHRAVSARQAESGLWDQITGGAKELANQFIKANAAMSAGWMAEKGIVKYRDKATGKTLTPEEVAQRYETEGKDAFAINGAGEQAGADVIKDLPQTPAIIEVATALGSRGKSLLRDPRAFAADIKKALTHSRSPAEALGEFGMGQANKRANFTDDKGFVKRYHGNDNLARDKDGGLAGVEGKGTKDGNTRVAKHGDGNKQISHPANEKRAGKMRNKAKQGKVGKPSNRQGGPYTNAEMALFDEIYNTGGKKRLVSTHTNTETGRVQVFERDGDGNIVKKIDDFVIDDFDNVKKTIEEAFKL